MANIVPTKYSKEKKSNRSSPSEAKSHSSYWLPEDLILEILVRLPLKSLIQFQTVCKRWKSLIKNPKFAKTQLHYSNQHHLPSLQLIFQYNSVLASYIDLNDYLDNPTKANEFEPKFVELSSQPFQKNDYDYIIVGSSNGIICFYLFKDNKLCLWNPIIHETRFISLPPNRKDEYCRHDILFSAFGYAPSIDDYKIVLLAKKNKYRDRSLIVYSLRRDNWSEYDHQFSKVQYFYDWFRNCQRFGRRVEDVVFNDALHFDMGELCSCEPSYIVKFDMVKECFEKVVDLPRAQYYSYWDATKMVVTEDSKTWYYQPYYEKSYKTDIDTDTDTGATAVIKRQVVEVFKLLDNNSWEMKVVYQGSWEDKDGRELYLIRISNNGKVLLFKEMTCGPWLIGKLHILDLRHGEPSFIQVNNEDNPPLETFPAHKYAKPNSASYVPSLVSPYSC